jgi:hypothetical protein
MTYKERLAGKTVNCLKCNTPVELTITQEDVIDGLYSDSYVSIGGSGEICLKLETLVEAKIAINNLRLRKKQLQLELKAVNDQLRETSKEYKEASKKLVKVPKAPTAEDILKSNGVQKGVDFFNLLIQNKKTEAQLRAIESLQRPQESKKAHVEYGIAYIEQAVIVIENWILQQGS